MKTHTTTTPTDADPFGCAEMAFRLILAAIMVGCAVSVSGCRSPIVEINRNAPLLPDVKLIEFNDSLNGSANGNTVQGYPRP
jgi:hypothetical protein